MAIKIRDELLAAKAEIQRKLESINPNSKQGTSVALKAAAFDKLVSIVEDEAKPKSK